MKDLVGNYMISLETLNELVEMKTRLSIPHLLGRGAIFIVYSARVEENFFTLALQENCIPPTQKIIRPQIEICCPEGEEVSAGTICRRWLDTPLVAHYASDGIICWWLQEAHLMVHLSVSESLRRKIKVGKALEC